MKELDKDNLDTLEYETIPNKELVEDKPVQEMGSKPSEPVAEPSAADITEVNEPTEETQDVETVEVSESDEPADTIGTYEVVEQQAVDEEIRTKQPQAQNHEDVPEGQQSPQPVQVDSTAAVEAVLEVQEQALRAVREELDQALQAVQQAKTEASQTLTQNAQNLSLPHVVPVPMSAFEKKHHNYNLRGLF